MICREDLMRLEHLIRLEDLIRLDYFGLNTWYGLKTWYGLNTWYVLKTWYGLITSAWILDTSWRLDTSWLLRLMTTSDDWRIYDWSIWWCRIFGWWRRRVWLNLYDRIRRIMTVAWTTDRTAWLAVVVDEDDSLSLDDNVVYLPMKMIPSFPKMILSFRFFLSMAMAVDSLIILFLVVEEVGCIR